MAKHDHPGMTRTQRRKLQKEEQQAAQKRAQRKKALLRWSLRSVAGILPLVILSVVFLHKPDVSNAGMLHMAKLQHNFGFVHVRGGIASTEIPLVNIGEGPLAITALDSSCGCTTASIVNHGVEGPSFGMASHGNNPKNWQTVINPVEQAVLKVYYNPTVHPELRGPVTRVVTIYSDDPENHQQEVRIKVNQID